MTDLIVSRHARRRAIESVSPDFRFVYSSERPRLVRLSHLITGSNAVAEDLVHDVFVAAFARWERIDDH